MSYTLRKVIFPGVFRCTWQRVPLFRCTWQHSISQHSTAVLDINMDHWSHHVWTLQGTPRIASSSTMCNFLLHFSCHSIALNLIFIAYTFSLIFPNFQSSLPQIEPMPSQVRNHYSQKNQEVHLERALAFKKAVNLCCPSIVCLPIIVHHASHIMLWMTNVADFIIEAGWWYWSGDQWWWKWWPCRVHHIVRDRRRQFGSQTGGPAFRPGTPGQVVQSNKGSTANKTEPCQYCYWMPSASKFPKSSWGNGTITAQTLKVNPPQQIIWLWLCTIHPGAAATQV